MKGFTLIELIVVMAVLGLVAVTVLPRLPAGLAGSELRRSTREVMAGLRSTRNLAIMRNRDETFRVDVEQRAFQSPAENRAHALPRGVAMRLVTATSELTSGTTGGIRFFSDGSSTGGRVLLSNRDREATVSVDWLTGQVASHD